DRLAAAAGVGLEGVRVAARNRRHQPIDTGDGSRRLVRIAREWRPNGCRIGVIGQGVATWFGPPLSAVCGHQNSVRCVRANPDILWTLNSGLRSDHSALVG